MIVREIILNALSLLGIAKHGVAPADQMEKAERILKNSLKTYSNDDTITAYQRVVNIVLEKDDTTIGTYIVSRGKRVTECEELPPIANAVVNRDYYRVGDEWWTAFNATSAAKAWKKVNAAECCDFVPDIIVNDMERIVSVKVFLDGRWVNLGKTNLAQLDPMDKYSYVANPDGERRERLYTAARGNCRIVYNTSMGNITMNTNIDLPSPYNDLVELSICVGCARTAEQLAKFSAQLAKVENNIEIANNNERCPVREVD